MSKRFFFLFLASAPFLAAANIVSTWKNSIGGVWSDPSNWTNTPAVSAFPHNNGADTFDVTVSLFAVPVYIVYLNSSLTVNNLTLLATSSIQQSGAVTAVNVVNTFTVGSGTYELGAGTLNAGAVTLSGGTLKLSGGSLLSASVTLAGGAVLGGGLSTTGLHFTSVSTSALDGVTLTGGLLLDTANARLRLRDDCVFTSATLTGNSAILAFEGTAADHTALLDNATIHLDGIAGTVSLEGSAPVLTIGPGGVVRGRGSFAQAQLGTVTGGAQLLNQGLVSADLSGQALTLTPQLITNTGTLRALNGATLNISSAAFTNAPGGTLSATGSSTLALQQGWHNAGALVLQDTSVVSLEGAFTTADLGLAGWNRTGGTVRLTGALDNSGSTFALTAATGTVVVNGGIVRGGTVTQSGSAVLRFSNANTNALDAAFVDGSLLLDQANGRLRLRQDATFTGATLTGNSAILSFEGIAADHTATLANATVNLDGVGVAVSLEGDAPVLTVAPTGAIRGRGAIHYAQLFTVTGTEQFLNQGTVSADLAGETLSIRPRLVTNAGTFRALNGATLTINSASFTNTADGTLSATGGATLALQQVWHNAGTIILRDTSVLSLEGAFTTADLGLAGWVRTGGTAKLLGTLDNTGASIALASGPGALALAGGVIKGGSLSQSGAASLVFLNPTANALDGVSVTGGLLLDQGNGRVRLRNDARWSGAAVLSGNSALLSFEGTAADSTATLADASLNLEGIGNAVSLDGMAPVLTIAPSGIVRGRGAINHSQLVTVTGTAQVLNQGLVSADVAGQSLTLAPHTLINTGVLEAKNGATLGLSAALAQQNAGTFRLAGGILQLGSSIAGPDLNLGAAARLEGYGEVRFANAATDSLALAGRLDPTPGAGGLVIKGDLVPAASAVLAFDLASGGSDFVSEAGSTPLALAGCTLRITLAAGFVPANAQTFTVLTSNQAITGSFGNVASGARLTTADGSGSFLVSYGGASVVLSDFQPTPPDAYATWLAGWFPGVTDPAIIRPAADPDGDGTGNLLEFALKGDPTSGANHGLSYSGLQSIGTPAAPAFTLVLAFRQGAVFTAQPDGSQRNLTAVDLLHCAVQGSATLAAFDQPILHSGPSFSGPAGSNLPDLTGSGWEYHTFYRDPSVTGPRVFLRAGVDRLP